jgi:hypothetical protein
MLAVVQANAQNCDWIQRCEQARRRNDLASWLQTGEQIACQAFQRTVGSLGCKTSFATGQLNATDFHEGSRGEELGEKIDLTEDKAGSKKQISEA